jgi:hypothetical protein
MLAIIDSVWCFPGSLKSLLCLCTSITLPALSKVRITTSCVRNADGKINTVRYDAVNAMLLNEFLKEHRKVTELETTVVQQRKDFQATTAHQQKQIEALTAGLQKVSAQVEASRPAPQMALNDP